MPAVEEHVTLKSASLFSFLLKTSSSCKSLAIKMLAD
jgi:hypothetical protein